MEGIGRLVRDLEEVVEFCNTTSRNGKPLSQDPTVRQRLAQIAIEIEAASCMAYRVADMQSRHEISLIEAGGLKVFTGELGERMAAIVGDIMGPAAQLKSCKYAPLNGNFEANYQTAMIISVAMGTNEIQKNVIAWYGLGLPRMK